MKRKSLIILGTLIFALTLTSCGAKDTPKDQPTASVESNENKDEKEEPKEAKENEEDSFLLEMIDLNKQGWEAMDNREFEKAETIFNEVLSHESEAKPSQAYLDDLERIEKDYEERVKEDPKARKKLAILYPRSYDSLDYLMMDCYAGLTEIKFHTEGQSKAGEYATNLYKTKQDERLRTLKESIYMTMVQTAYVRGHIIDSFIKEESEQLIPEFQGKILVHSVEAPRSLPNWTKHLGRLYYYLEDFETFLDIFYDGQDLEEMEPVEIEGNKEATNLATIIYGLRWNEEEEEYENFMLDRWWGYANEPSTEEIYCDIHGRYVSLGFSAGDHIMHETFTYDDNGLLATQYDHGKSDSFSQAEDIVDIKVTWWEYSEWESDAGKPDLPSFVLAKERPLYFMQQQVHGESYVYGELNYASDTEVDNYFSQYGEDIIDYGY